MKKKPKTLNKKKIIKGLHKIREVPLNKFQPKSDKAKPAELAIIKRDDDRAVIPDSSNLEKLGKFLFQSHLFPAVQSVSGAVTIIEYGRELGLKPVQALQTMSIIKGRICIEAKALLALAIQKGLTYKILKSNDDICQIQFSRANFEPHVETFTSEDAKRAKLTDKTSYVQYPRIMNLWRCVSNGIRAYAPDLALGLYSKEEVGADDIIEVHVQNELEPKKDEEEKQKAHVLNIKDSLIEDIKYKVAKAGIEVKEFKKFLEVFQHEGTKETREFVGYKFGNLSFHEGKTEDLLLLKQNLPYAIDQFKKSQKEKTTEATPDSNEGGKF